LSVVVKQICSDKSYPDHKITTDSDISTVHLLLNDAQAQPGQNTKSVEYRLKLTYQKLAAAEANIFLLSKLKSMDLATNDVTSFVNKQFVHKRILFKPDVKVQRAAMHSKLKNALVFTSQLRQERVTLKRKISRKYSNLNTKARRICYELVDFYHKIKEKEMN